MQEDKGRNDNNQWQTLYEESIPEIQELKIGTLSHFSQQFRLSFIDMEQQLKNQNPQTETQLFHANIVKLIAKIQPAKVSLCFAYDEILFILSAYYAQNQGLQSRTASISKSFFSIDKLTSMQEYELFIETQSSIGHVKKCLMLRESQLGMVLFIQDNSKKYPPEQFIKMYQQNFSQIMQFIIPIQKCFVPINYFLLSRMLEEQNRFYEEFVNKSQRLKQQINQCRKLIQQEKVIRSASRQIIQSSIRHLKIITSKMSTIADLFPIACVKSQDDLFSKGIDDPRWRRLFDQDKISYKLYGDAATVNKSFDKLKANLNVINAAMNIMSQNNQTTGIKNIGKVLESVGKVLQVAFSSQNAQHQAEVMISNPNQRVAKEIWNLPQRKQFKNFILMTLPSIQFSAHFYIPKATSTYFHAKLRNLPAKLSDFVIANPAKYYQQLYIPSENGQKISIRINNYFQLALKQFKQQQPPRSWNFFEQKLNQMAKNVKMGVDNIKSKFKTANQPPKSVILHIHGGGFISMSSFIHQTYTRTWANNLKVPIVSVDYGKAPQHPFPQGLADCLQAYLWALHCMKQLYQFQPVKIILVGDSAGGNLVAALTTLLIEWNMRPPDGIVLVYPALNLNYYDYTPSLLTALNDMILPHTFLKICLKSYLQNPDIKPDQNYLASPIFTPNKILRKYPETRIFVGSKDPFHDDCCRFAERLSTISQKNVQLKIFDQFPHGFLQFDMKTQPHYYCGLATKEVQQALGELLKYC